MDRIKLATYTALVFFTIGTLLLILRFSLENAFAVTIIGFYYVLLSIAINGLLVLVLILALIFDNHRIKTLKSIGILLLNIPIAWLYFLIATQTLSL